MSTKKKPDYKAKAVEAMRAASAPPDAGHALALVPCIWKGKHLAVTEHFRSYGEENTSLYTVTHARSGYAIMHRLSRFEARLFAGRLDRFDWSSADPATWERIARAVAAAQKAFAGTDSECAC